VDVRRPPADGVVDDLVDEQHDRAVRLRDGLFPVLALLLFRTVQPADDVRDRRFIPMGLVEIDVEPGDVLRKGDIVADRLRLEEVLDHVPFDDVVRVAHQDMMIPSVFSMGTQSSGAGIPC
jgi:hypothetical protein